MRWPWAAAPGWWIGARCRAEGVPLEVFFTRETTEQARAVCVECPVRLQCLTVHLEEPFGVWGGHPLDERRRIESMMDRGATLGGASRAIRRPNGQG